MGIQMRNGSEGAWNISTVNILTKLKQNPPLPPSISAENLKYTVLDPRHTYRDTQELAELHSCDPSQLVNSYVAFRPERLALHESIVGVITTVQVENEEEMQEVVKRVHERVLQTTVIDDLHRMREQIQIQVAESLTDYLSNPEGIFDPIVKESFMTVKNRRSGYAFGQYKPGYSEHDAMIALATDRLFATKATLQLKTSVRNIIEKDTSLKLIAPPSPTERLTLMVTGGISSGKGSSVATMKLSADNAGIKWKNIAKVNGDSLKTLLLDPHEVKAELFSQLAQEEASVLSKIKIKGELRQMIIDEKAPHMFFDQTRIEQDAIWGVKKGGKVVGLIVSTDVESAITRAAIRGNETGRYESTQNIVGNHKAVAEELVTALPPLKGFPAQFTLYDNNGDRDHLPEVVMTIDTANKQIEVIDESKLQSFVKKCTINSIVSGPSGLYTGTKTNDEYLDDLKKLAGYDSNRPQIAISDTPDTTPGMR